MSKYVFISYAQEDSEYVEKLAGFLSKSGIDAWYDAQLVPVGGSTTLFRKRSSSARPSS